MAASSLNHPNIITIYEINSEGDTDFIVMEHVRGTTLSKRIKAGPIPIDEAVGYAAPDRRRRRQRPLHRHHHRDLKPANVMITHYGLVKVLDFGLAKFDASSINTQSSGEHQIDMTLSLAGAVTGTIAYMSPEQARGERVDIRSDVFSFGIVFYEMLAGQLPFAGPNAMAILHNIHFSPPHDLRELRLEAPPALATLLTGRWKASRTAANDGGSGVDGGVGSRAAGTRAVTWRSGRGDTAGDWAFAAVFGVSGVIAGAVPKRQEEGWVGFGCGFGGGTWSGWILGEEAGFGEGCQ